MRVGSCPRVWPLCSMTACAACAARTTSLPGAQHSPESWLKESPAASTNGGHHLAVSLNKAARLACKHEGATACQPFDADDLARSSTHG